MLIQAYLKRDFVTVYRLKRPEKFLDIFLFNSEFHLIYGRVAYS